APAACFTRRLGREAAPPGSRPASGAHRGRVSALMRRDYLVEAPPPPRSFRLRAIGGELVAVEVPAVARVGVRPEPARPTAPSSLPPAASAALWKAATAARLGAAKLTVPPLAGLAGSPSAGVKTMNSSVDTPQHEPRSPRSLSCL